MRKYIVNGGTGLSGVLNISGSKNVITKAIVASSLSSEEIEIQNVPDISDVRVALEVASELGAKIIFQDGNLKIRFSEIKNSEIPLSAGIKSRTSTMFLGPLLARQAKAKVPNPGGCRLGARPIDRHIKGLEKMGAKIIYKSEDGYFHAVAPNGLRGTDYTFLKNTHTGTETLILAAVLASGKTVLRNAAEEPEVDDLINLLNKMGAKIKRIETRVIEIIGVEKLSGTTYKIMPDRNETVTFAVLSAVSGGKIFLKNAQVSTIGSFMEAFEKAGGKYEESERGIRFFIEKEINPVDVLTAPHPGFMTDWQGPWSILMTQANGQSIIHETIYENRFSYVSELLKMGAHLEFFTPEVSDAKKVYNFDFDPKNTGHYSQGLRIKGPTPLHNAVLSIADLRAGATLVIAALIARGKSEIYGIDHIERGYEDFDKRLKSIGAQIELEGEKS